MEFLLVYFNKIFNLLQFNKTALYKALEIENIEIINLLLSTDKIDVNTSNIHFLFLIIFIIKLFNVIENQMLFK